MNTPYVEHVNISVRSIERALFFLRSAFPAFEVRLEGGPPERRWCHVGTDRSYVALEQPEPASDAGRESYRDVGINHVGFVVDDLASIRARLTEAGFREGITAEPHPGRLRAYFFDDDGNEYEFVQYLVEDPAARNAL